MAAVHDILARASALGAVTVYQSAPAAWLRKAAAVAAEGVPVVVNCRGVKDDALPVIVSLAQLEQLTRAAQLLANAEIAQPDGVDW